MSDEARREFHAVVRLGNTAVDDVIITSYRVVESGALVLANANSNVTTVLAAGKWDRMDTSPCE